MILKEFIETLYRTIVKIVTTKPQEMLPIPELPQPDEEGNEPPEEDKAAVQKEIDEAQAANAEAEKANEQLARLHAKVRVVQRAHID